MYISAGYSLEGNPSVTTTTKTKTHSLQTDFMHFFTPLTEISLLLLFGL